jgi:argininosuccinate lyase
MIELSRLAADIILYSHPSIAAIRLPDEHVSTSSAMPHKRNPVTAEVLRARAARAAGLAAAALAVNHGLPSGYNLDLQEENPIYYQVLLEAVESVRVLKDLVEKLEVDPGAVERMIESGAVLASLEAAERMAVEKGIPFRDAYLEVARRVRSGSETSLIHPKVDEVVKLRVSLGSAGPGLLEAIREARRLLTSLHSSCTRLEELLSRIDSWVSEGAEELCR